jgi:hypothetical protein
MTFLNPFVLFGLAAAAIPILIHLFNIRKLRTIEFSTLSFLKELNKNKIRKIKIRQWLLLILRTLLILVIVLAFSRPALKGNFGSAGSRAKSTLVILLDNSASMSLSNEQGKFLSQAQAHALKVVSLLQENDEVFFLRLTDLPNATTEEPTHDAQKLESLIRETEIRYSHRTIEEGIRLASRLLRQSKNFNKELFVITDGQATTLTSGTGQKSSVEPLFEPQTKIFFTRLSRRQSENASLERTTVSPSLFQINRPFTLNAVVKNYGTAAISNHLVSVVFGGSRVMQKSVSLGGGESATLEFSLTPGQSGCIPGYVEIEEDIFDTDDRRYFSVNIPGRIKLSLITTEERYSRYISAALNAAAMTTGSAPVSVTSITPSQITSTALAQTDVVILSGIKALSLSQQDVLNNYLSNGGNVLFFPAADTTSLSYDYLKPFGLSGFQLSRAAATFEKVDLQFPIFQGMFDQGLQKNKANIESPQISLSVTAATETDVRSIISLSNGKNFLWLKNVGRGKLLGTAVPASTEWSDLPLKGIFVPLLYQSVLFLSSPLNTADDKNYTVGEKIEFNSSILKKGRTISPSSLQLFDAESRKIPVQTYVKMTGEGLSETIFTFDDPRVPGIYSARVENDTVLALPINSSREESNGTLADEGQIKSMLAEVGISESAFTELPPDADVESTVTQSRFGIELWRYLLLAAMVIALIEMFVAREPKQQ